MSRKKIGSRAEKNNSELKEKGHEPSRAELKIPQLELWLEPARLGLITSIYCMPLRIHIYQPNHVSLETLWKDQRIYSEKTTKFEKNPTLFFDFTQLFYFSKKDDWNKHILLTVIVELAVKKKRSRYR